MDLEVAKQELIQGIQNHDATHLKAQPDTIDIIKITDNKKNIWICYCWQTSKRI